MKRFFTLTFVLVLFVAAPLAADCHRQRVVVQHHAAVVNHHVAAVVAPVYVAQYVPVQVPTYSVGYAAPQQQQDASLALAVEKLSLAVERLSKGGAQPQADTLQSKALGILNARCASCHSDATAKAGGDFVLFKGNQLNPSIDVLDVTHAISRARAGSMPPKSAGAPLSDDEISVLQHFGDEMTKQVRAVRKTQGK